MNLDWFVQTSSVQTFPSIIQIVKMGNFEYKNVSPTSIYTFNNFLN